MEFAVADLLKLPMLRSAQVLTEGFFDPYRPVAARLLNDQATDGQGLFRRAEPAGLQASLAERNGWPAICVVSAGADSPPDDETYAPLVRRAASKGTALLWLRTPAHPDELEHQLHRELLAYHQAQIEESHRIQRRLNEIVVTGGTLQTICRELALATGNPVSIKTSYHEVVAFHDVGSPDEARRRTNEAGRIPEDVLRVLKQADLPRRLQREVGAFRFGPLPAIDYHSRVMAPIRTESALWGYISIAESTNQLGLLYLRAVEAAAYCAALIVWKNRALEQRAREQQSQYIGDLLFAEQEQEILTARALMLGYDAAEWHSAVVFEWRAGPVRPGPRATATPTDSQLREVARFIDSYLASRGARSLVFSIPVGNRVVCLWPSSAGEPDIGAAAVLNRLANMTGFDGMRAGVGGSSSEGDSLAHSYRRALLACRLTAAEEQVAVYANLGLARIVVENSESDELATLADQYLRAIEEYDTARGRELLPTLEAYFACGRNYACTAESLVVHLNTVKYRLRRCAELAGVDLDDPVTALNLEIALVIRRVLRLARG